MIVCESAYYYHVEGTVIDTPSVITSGSVTHYDAYNETDYYHVEGAVVDVPSVTTSGSITHYVAYNETDESRRPNRAERRGNRGSEISKWNNRFKHNQG